MIEFPTLPEAALPYLRVALIAVVAIVAWVFLRIAVRVSTRGLIERRALEADAATMPPMELERRVNTIGRLVTRIGGAVILVIAVLMALGQFSIDIGPAVAGLGVVGIAVGIFGRVIQWKGQREFLEAAIAAAGQDPRIRPVIVGDESDGGRAYIEAVHALASQSGLGDRIIFAGYQSEVEPYYAAMDIVVHASITPEPFGMVVPEAMRMMRGVYRRRRLTVPTLVVLGRRDRPTTEDLLLRLCRNPARYADRMELAWVDDAAHFITDDAPDAVAELALGWFERAA